MTHRVLDWLDYLLAVYFIIRGGYTVWTGDPLPENFVGLVAVWVGVVIIRTTNQLRRERRRSG